MPSALQSSSSSSSGFTAIALPLHPRRWSGPWILSFALQALVVCLAMSFAGASSESALHGSANDLSALLALKAQVSDPLGILHRNWSTNTSFCHWAGVSCSRRRQRVTALALNDTPLQGTIPSQLGNLSFLSLLNLSNTGLTGTIPAELGRLPRLRYLALGQNHLSSTIPPALSNLTRLELLDVHHNDLSGGIPQELQNLHNLQEMLLEANGLSGSIPQDLFNCTPMLRVLYLGNNSFSGPIPEGIVSLHQLQILILEANLFSGPIPGAIFNMSSLQTLAVGRNNLSGSVPGNESFYLPFLQIVTLSHNWLTGPIPSSFTKCRHLQELSLSWNYFTGVVPVELATLAELTYISLGTNYLVGTIPAALSNLSRLEQLDLSHSMLHGEIPPELGRLSKLWWLNLDVNHLAGTIPPTIDNISLLSQLDLSHNNLTGSVPASFGNIRDLRFLNVESNQLSGKLGFIDSLSNCRGLEVLDISMNSFVGRISDYVANLSSQLQILLAHTNQISGGVPSTVANLSNLIWLDLYGNQLTGTIPESMTAINSLQKLDVSDNNMSGTIPSRVGELQSMDELHLDGNRFSGPIPDAVGNLSELQTLTLSLNLLSSTIPSSLWHLRNLLKLNLSHNSLSGSVPSDAGSLNAITVIDLSANQMLGSLPASLGELQTLTYLNLSHNSFQGSIPDSVGQLTSIVSMDLSSNALSGAIPDSLAKLHYLVNLNLSFNRLEGWIPEDGIFSNITLNSLMGNSGLCGAARLGFPACGHEDRSSSHSRLKGWFMKFVLPAIAAVGILSVCFCLFIKAKFRLPSTQSISCSAMEARSFHRELARATENFSEANLLGAGSFGKVFKGRLDDGSVVAIKVFDLQFQGASRSFDAECRAMRMARHRNLVPILHAYCSSDLMALVLQYMPNGSLEKWLHSNINAGPLRLLQRVEIMLDVAKAMEHLHYHHFEVVLHCDLKPSNVLLDDDMTAHVADFGIAKLLLGDNTSIMSTSMPGTIGYMAPEYGSIGRASRGADVYSYGILLLEVFTRKKPTDAMFSGECNLRRWVHQSFPSRIEEVVDCNLLQDEASIGVSGEKRPLEDSRSRPCTCLESVMELGLLCSRELPRERITMKEVVVRLNKIKLEHLSNCSGT